MIYSWAEQSARMAPLQWIFVLKIGEELIVRHCLAVTTKYMQCALGSRCVVQWAMPWISTIILSIMNYYVEKSGLTCCLAYFILLLAVETEHWSYEDRNTYLYLSIYESVRVRVPSSWSRVHMSNIYSGYILCKLFITLFSLFH